jgi:hypothetical protein
MFLNRLYGLSDIHTVLANHRKIGGAAEASMLRLSSGEVYRNPVFINIDISKGQYVSICFIDENGEHTIAHIDQIAVIKDLQHKLICQLENAYARQFMLRDTIKYLERLCEINEGFVTHTFKKEAIKLVRDISMTELKKHEIVLPFAFEEKLIHFNERLHA